jgi:hypothetical protein
MDHARHQDLVEGHADLLVAGPIFLGQEDEKVAEEIGVVPSKQHAHFCLFCQAAVNIIIFVVFIALNRFNP